MDFVGAEVVGDNVGCMEGLVIGSYVGSIVGSDVDGATVEGLAVV